MTIEALGFIKDLLIKNGINYELMQMNGEITYPYFVGEFIENESFNENGKQESLFILNGFNRGKMLELLQAKEVIEKLDNTRCILSNGNALVINYANSQPIQTGIDELKRLQINLKINEWKGGQ